MRGSLGGLVLLLATTGTAQRDWVQKIRNKYTITTIVEKVIQDEDLPTLEEVLQGLNMEDKLQAFHDAEVYETRYLLKMNKMDLQMLGFTREEMAAVKEVVDVLAVAPTEVVVQDGPELLERDELSYGRLFIDNSPSSYEYYLASFGSRTPLGSGELVWAEPRTGCDTSEMVDQTGNLVLVERGEYKAYSIAATNASAMLVLNNEEELFHLASSHTLELEDKGPQGMATVMLRHSSQLPLEQAVQWGKTKGRLIPLKCQSGSAVCHAVLEEEEALAQSVRGGRLVTQAGEVEFVAGRLGSTFPSGPIQLASSEPRRACQELTNGSELRGKAVMVWRGGCSFGDKLLLLQEAGARMVILVDDSLDPLQPFGATSEQSKAIYTPALLVTQQATVLLENSRDQGMTVDVVVDESVADAWVSLANVEWPEEDIHKQVLTMQLREQHQQSKDRLDWIGVKAQSSFDVGALAE